MAHTPQDAIDALHMSPAYEDDSTVFVIVQNYLLRSTNRGASWKQLVSGLDSPYVLSDITLSPGFAEDGTLFVSTDGGGIYRSVDRGQTWHRFNQGLEQENVGIVLATDAFDGPAILAAGSQRGLFVSSASEASWRRAMSDDVQITSLKSVHSGPASYVLAGDSTGGIWKSGAGPGDWRRLARLNNAGAVTALAVTSLADASDPIYVGTQKSGLLSISVDGLAEKRLSMGWPDRQDDCLGNQRANALPDQHIRDIEILKLPDGGNEILATSWSRAVHVSRDGGTSWELKGRGITCDNQADSYAIGVPHYRDLEVGHSLQTDMFVAGFDGVYRSEDGGESWVQFETLPVSLIRGMAISASADGLYGLVVTTYGGGAYVSADRGHTWTIANLGLVTTRLADVEFSPRYPADTTLYSLSKERLLVGNPAMNGWDARSLVYRGWRRRVGAGLERRLGFSPDFGTRLFLSDAERRRVWPMQIELSPAFDEDRTMFVGLREHGVWKSSDAGESWNRDWNGPVEFVTALQVSPDYAYDQTVFMGMRGNGIFVSRDGADSWQAANAGFSFLEEVRATQSPNYYVDPPLYNAIKDVLLVVSPNYGNDHTAFASSADGLFRSRDGGQSWSELVVASSLDDVPVNALGISPAYSADATVVVSFKGRGLFRSSDGGTTFESIGKDLLAQNLDLKLIEFSPNYKSDHTIYGATDEVVLRSGDDGVTWTTIDRPVRYENWRGEDHGPIRFIGKWAREKGLQLSATSQEVSEQQDAQATLNFYGNGITWIAERGPDGGQAQVALDGVAVATVDLYSANRMPRQPIFELHDLDPGPHNIQVLVSGTKNAKSAGYRIAVDSFDVLNSNHRGTLLSEPTE